MKLTLLALLSYVPFLHPIFNTAALGWREWVFVLTWAPIMLALDELRKAILRSRSAKAEEFATSKEGVEICKSSSLAVAG